MKGYAFFVPQDIIGKTVVVEGVSYVKTTTVSELKHFAEDAKKSKKEIEAITQPQKQLRVMADGILVIQ
jgi:ABC-type transporter Mla MlaB component